MAGIENCNENESINFDLNSINTETNNDLCVLENNITYQFNPELKNEVLEQYPRLKIIEGNLQIDGWSKLENIKRHLDDLSTLPNGTLNKIRQNGKFIYISDRPPALAWEGFSPQGIDRAGRSWYNCHGFNYEGNIFVGRGLDENGYYLADEEYINKHTVFHELGHSFDYMSGNYSFSNSQKLKNFFNQFYDDKIRDNDNIRESDKEYLSSYDEFFAECSLYFFWWDENTFKEYFNEEFYDYMKRCLT